MIKNKKKFVPFLTILTLIFISAEWLAPQMASADPACIAPPLGDINKDKKIDASDVNLLKDCILNKAPNSADCSVATADINRDGKVTTLDVLALQTTVNGKCTKPTPTPTATPNRSKGPYSCLNAWGPNTCREITGVSFLPGTDMNTILFSLGGLCYDTSNIRFAACPTQNIIGTCTTASFVNRYYPPFTVATAQPNCIQNGGAFKAGP